MNEERQSEVKAKLIIRGFDSSPEEITQLLDICPTQTWLCGETVTPRAKNVHKHNGWLLASPCAPVGSSVSEQVDSILSIVEPHVNAFTKLPVGTNVELYCVMYVTDYRRPVIILSTDTIRRLAQLSASFSIDIYDFREIQP